MNVKRTLITDDIPIEKRFSQWKDMITAFYDLYGIKLEGNYEAENNDWTLDLSKINIIVRQFDCKPTLMLGMKTSHTEESLNKIKEEVNVMDLRTIITASDKMIGTSCKGEIITSHTTLFYKGIIGLVVFYQGCVDLREYIKRTLVNLGVQEKDLTMNESDNDLHYKEKKICGILQRSARNNSFALGSVIIDYKDELFKKYLPEDEYNRFNGKGCTGVQNEFPTITEDIFIEEFLKVLGG